MHRYPRLIDRVLTRVLAWAAKTNRHELAANICDLLGNRAPDFGKTWTFRVLAKAHRIVAGISHE